MSKYCVNFAVKSGLICLIDMAVFACHDDWQLGSFLTKHTHTHTHIHANGSWKDNKCHRLVYEPLASSDDN